MALYIVKPWYKKQAAPAPIYGAEWAGTSSPAWTRTDDAASFADPNPYYAGMSGAPSSPFDNIMPWSGIRRVTDASAGELVEIPKFYYKWTRDGVKMKLQISMSAFDGSHVSPAHADRGDGVGERDYVYVGRYHCSTNDYKSTSGVKPKASISKTAARTAIHNIGSNIWQFDFALWWTINMLYLVEFANWNSQAMIGYGCGNNSSTENSGASDTMPYHTGTMKSNRTTSGVGIQYRYVEDYWANVIDWCDGIYFSGKDNVSGYCIKNPANFSDTTGGTYVGDRLAQGAFITSFTNPAVNGFEYALIPNGGGGSDSTYITDWNSYYYIGNAIQIGGKYKETSNGVTGAFAFWGYDRYFDSASHIGARLMVLPSSRII